MELLGFLILFPLIPAVLLAVIPNQTLRGWLVRLSVLVIAAASIYLAVQYLGHPAFFKMDDPWTEKGLLTGELLLTLFLLYQCKDIKRQEAWIPVLLLAQAGVMAYTEFGVGLLPVDNSLYIDNFSIIMALIIGIIGGLICVYAVAYMKDFHHHHPQMKDKRRGFFFLLFFFLSAMFGVVFSNHLGWLFFFWEVTTLCSFMMIRYTEEEEAKRNAYRALGLNLMGGVGFSLALMFMAQNHLPFALDHLIDLGKTGALIAVLPATLICFAGLTKSAQLPFSSWLLGAMVAPTPVSALLHSSTMVKAGVFIIVKFAPVMEKNPKVGFFLGLVGGVTFLVASLAAVTQSNAKRVLAYSTIANLGLVVACAGVGSPEAIWAAILLIIFHAISKGLLFQAVGTTEHKIGSRDIEDMDGLIITHPGLAFTLLIGILGMFLAPFGMLISKWACLEAFMVSNPLLAILLAFGSAPTLFFWGKWMGKLISIPSVERVPEHVSGDEWTSLGILSILTMAACGLFPVISRFVIIPYLGNGTGDMGPLAQGNVIIMLIMLGLILITPLAFLFYPRKEIKAPIYLSGVNVNNGNSQFRGPMFQNYGVEMRNYYLTSVLDEKGLNFGGGGVAIAFTLAMFWMAFTTLGGAVLLPGLAAQASTLSFDLSQTLLVFLLFLIGAPILGGLLAGMDRIVTARMQGRVGPPILQPFYDVLKLMDKRTVVVNGYQTYYAFCFLLFMLMTGTLFFLGGDLLLVVFALTISALFLVLAGFSPNSPYSNIGAERELLQMMAYEPMLLLTVLGMYQVTRSFNVDTIFISKTPLLYLLPGIFLGFLFILTIKLRKSPFDLSTSHHGHQELVKGLTTEFSGSTLALIEIGHWYENVFLLGLIYLFFAAFSPWIAILATVVVYLFEILIDNAYARLTWQITVRSSWMIALVLGVTNLLLLVYLK
jgi:ech hydrogenase subunit A